MADYQINDSIGIALDSALTNVAANFLFSECKVIEVREKAVRLQGWTAKGKEITSWFPKKALKVISSDNLHGSNTIHHTVELAHWFRPSKWTARFLDLTARASALYA